MNLSIFSKVCSFSLGQPYGFYQTKQVKLGVWAISPLHIRQQNISIVNLCAAHINLNYSSAINSYLIIIPCLFIYPSSVHPSNDSCVSVPSLAIDSVCKSWIYMIQYNTAAANLEIFEVVPQKHFHLPEYDRSSRFHKSHTYQMTSVLQLSVCINTIRMPPKLFGQKTHRPHSKQFALTEFLSL